MKISVSVPFAIRNTLYGNSHVACQITELAFSHVFAPLKKAAMGGGGGGGLILCPLFSAGGGGNLEYK